jgi:hypothetical protein
MNHKIVHHRYDDMQSATMAYTAIFSRMHSWPAGPKFGYFNRATDSI